MVVSKMSVVPPARASARKDMKMIWKNTQDLSRAINQDNKSKA